MIGRDPKNGDKGCATTEKPVRAFDGVPAITATDLSSDSLGFMWGQTRSWTGLNNASFNGNGWAISQLPYLVVGGGTNGSCLPGRSCDGVLPGTTPDDRISVVEGGVNVHTFTIPPSGPYTTYAPWGAEKITLTWVSGTPPVVSLTDSYGDVTQFYDVYRDGTGRPVPHSLGIDQAQKYGRFKSYTAADGSTQVSATYDGNGFPTTVTRSSPATGITEEMVYTYATVTNDLVTAAGDAPPQLLASVTLQRPDGLGGWVPAARARYTYYTGRLSDGLGGWVNDTNGRLGDLQLVQPGPTSPTAGAAPPFTPWPPTRSTA